MLEDFNLEDFSILQLYLGTTAVCSTVVHVLNLVPTKFRSAVVEVEV